MKAENTMLAAIKRWRTQPAPSPAPAAAVAIQGYLDERSTHHVRGWARDLNDPAARVAVEAVLPAASGEIVLARGTADRASDHLREIGVGDGVHEFDLRFDPPLDESRRDRVFVRAAGRVLDHAPALSARRPDEPPPRLAGYLDERSPLHVAGWVWNEANPLERVPYEVLDGEDVIAAGVAETWHDGLAKIDIGDAKYGFRVVFPSAVADARRVSVRLSETRATLEVSPRLRERYEPISHVAMDIVNNCNLRCPFCTFDYAGTRTTRFMQDETFAAALRLLPWVTEGNFWLSCLHEATIHPELLRFVDMVPREYRDRLMYTSNLAKRMPDAYFAQLGASGMHHLNISLESLVPETYERLRKGARFPIFQQNWAKLLDACRAGSAPPRLRYNMMAYRSNLHEIPGLVQLLLDEKLAWQVEVRYTFDEPHIPQAFRAAEYLRDEEWTWLQAQLAHHDTSRVLLMLPPPGARLAAPAPPSPAVSEADDGEAPPAPDPVIDELIRPSFPLGMRIEWDGRLFVYSEAAGADGVPRHTNHMVTNIREVRDPTELIARMMA